MPEHFSAFDVSLILLAFTGLSLAGVMSLLYARKTQATTLLHTKLHHEKLQLSQEVQQLQTLLQSEPQVVMIYGNSTTPPRIEGAMALLFPQILPTRLPSFNTWLPPQEASKLEKAFAQLQERGQSFTLELVALSQKTYEVKGQVSGAQAMLRFSLLAGLRETARLETQTHDETRARLTAYENLFHLIPFPLWLRNAEGKLQLVNRAYAKAVELRDGATVVQKGTELLDLTTRNSIRTHFQTQGLFSAQVRALAAGERRLYDVQEQKLDEVMIGFAQDITQLDALQKERAGEIAAQRRIFDQLGVALAIFDAERALIFYNAPCQKLWDLTPSQLDNKPREGDIFDRLRDKGRLPEVPNYREWKKQFLELKPQAVQEPREEQWYMPDQSSLKVTQFVNELGGFTYLFEDITQHHALERRHSALTLLQRETIEHLSEAVGVYGSDGRLSLSNAGFAKFWQMDEALRESRPHIEQLTHQVKLLFKDSYPLEMLQGVVTGLQASREPYAAQLERLDGAIIQLIASPMPDGGTLTTARDATSEVNAKRLLLERNEALQTANNLKSVLVQNVSYEMRAPLQNILGFTQMLDHGLLGALPQNQKEYLHYILRSTQQLETVIDTLLDFAALEAGRLELNPHPFEIKTAMLNAIESVQGKRTQDNIKITLETALNLGSMQGDERRMRQIFTAILSNAVGFSPSNGNVIFRAERLNETLLFTIKDDGPGISDAQRGQIFEAFTSFSAGTGHRGMGLGLSLAKALVELHQGRLSVESAAGQGTSVMLHFPNKEVLRHAA